MLSFLPISALEIRAFRAFVKECAFFEKSCEYTYANLFAWRDAYKTAFAQNEYGLFFKMQDSGEDFYLCPICPKEHMDAAFEALHDHAKTNGDSALRFVCLPRPAADRFKALYPQAELSTDRGKADYIYSVTNLSTFPGKALHAKKNHRNKFFSVYGDRYEYRVMTARDVPTALAFNDVWYALNTDSDFSDERNATEELLRNFDALALCGGMIFVDGALCAYTLASDSYDGSDTLVIHTEKGLYDIQGIYPTICSEFLLHEGEPYTFVNREDDLGNEGLRKSKLSYQPIGFEEKFSVTLVF